MSKLLTLTLITILLTGCGTLNAGFSRQPAQSQYAEINTEQTITWVTEIEPKSALLTVHEPIVGEEAESYISTFCESSGTSFNKESTMNWNVVKVTFDESIDPDSILKELVINVMTSENGKFEFNGILYDTPTYYMEDGMYAYMIPKGCGKYLIKAGNTYFEINN